MNSFGGGHEFADKIDFNQGEGVLINTYPCKSHEAV